MSSLRSLVRRGDDGGLSPLARRVAVVLAVVTPLLIAGVAVTALQTDTASAASGADASTPLLPAAVVNQDVLVYVGSDGTVSTTDPGGGTPVAAGKLLVSELTKGTSGEGFDWSVTDSGTASEGLGSGQFSAVVTIPTNFSAAYASTATTEPVQAQLQVQTNGATSYVTEMLAAALSSDLQSALSEQSTKQYVTGTLGAFTELDTQLGKAATGAGELTNGATQLAGYSGDLATAIAGAAKGSTDLDTAVQGLAVGMNAIAVGTTDLPVYADKLAQGTAIVNEGVTIVRGQFQDRAAESQSITDQQSALALSLGALYDSMDPADPDRDAVGAAAAAAGAIAVEQGGLTVLLDLDYLGVDTVLSPGASLVSQGAAEFAADLPLLTTTLTEVAKGTGEIAVGTGELAKGLGEISTGATGIATGSTELATNLGLLSSGLGELATNVPSYTDAQQQTISTVVSAPVVTEQTDIDALPSPTAAIAAVAVPLALWIGAFAIYLLLAPFSRRALASTASTFRVVIGALVPAAVLALVQGAVVAVVLFAVGAAPTQVAGGILFSLIMSLAFVMLHQGLVALFGQAGRLISLALVVVQIAAAAVIVPGGLSSPLYTGLASVLPLTHAVKGMQALIGGGSPGVAAQEALVLLVFAAVGLVFTLIAVSRARSRSTVAPRAVLA
ncbi:YhgE/Pip family protein [Herbiconiux liukaitaii]|uniref:YhgE/Pip family protein n=1 Tax=Herbiconiux liukaitaii TaxID=3342799 RepID=UPI0035BA261F